MVFIYIYMKFLIISEMIKKRFVLYILLRYLFLFSRILFRRVRPISFGTASELTPSCWVSKPCLVSPEPVASPIPTPTLFYTAIRSKAEFYDGGSLCCITTHFASISFACGMVFHLNAIIQCLRALLFPLVQ